MRMYRATRYLINKVDAKLGDIDKEIKFDKIIIYSCLGVIAMEVFFLALSSIGRIFMILSILGSVFTALCLFIIPVMVQELKEDQEKAKKEKGQGIISE